MFENLENSHMPFIYQYNNVDVGMCCLKVNNVWKIFHTFNGTLERLDTGLSDNETECSPNFFITDNNEIVFSFIGGNSGDNPRYYLYRKYGLTGRVERVTETQIGYCLKDMVVKSVNDRKTLNIKSDTYEETISFEGVRQIYRAIYNSVFPA